MTPSETPPSAPGSERPGLALVTGASSGIGRSLARELGSHVVAGSAKNRAMAAASSAAPDPVAARAAAKASEPGSGS